MADHKACAYEEKIASSYDTWFSSRESTQDTVDRLAELAGSGPVLELGVGTGRVALPLAERGVNVHGIDASEAMVARLRAKPGGDRIPLTIGDFSEVPVDGAFSLVYAASATFFELQTQDAQVRCVANVARHLTPGGLFVLDGLFLDAMTSQPRHNLRAFVQDGQLRLMDESLDRSTQHFSSRCVIIAEDSIDFVDFRLRHAWPSELDLMARMSGLELTERWGTWSADPFTHASQMHVSVYRAAGPQHPHSQATPSTAGH